MLKKPRNGMAREGYFWGMMESQLASLNRSKSPQWVVLLMGFIGPEVPAYVATADRVGSLSLSFQWGKGEYKIHESEIPNDSRYARTSKRYSNSGFATKVMIHAQIQEFGIVIE